jgi:hypothetical protein
MADLPPLHKRGGLFFRAKMLIKWDTPTRAGGRNKARVSRLAHHQSM